MDWLVRQAITVALGQLLRIRKARRIETVDVSSEFVCEQHVKWFDSEIEQEKAYHHQKEATAWAATAFYWTGVLVFSSAVAPRVTGDGSPWVGLPLGVLMLVIVVLVGVYVQSFVQAQFEARKEADEKIRRLKSGKRWLLKRIEDSADMSTELSAELRLVRRELEHDGTRGLLDRMENASSTIVMLGTIAATVILLASVLGGGASSASRSRVLAPSCTRGQQCRRRDGGFCGKHRSPKGASPSCGSGP